VAGAHAIEASVWRLRIALLTRYPETVPCFPRKHFPSKVNTIRKNQNSRFRSTARCC